MAFFGTFWLLFLAVFDGILLAQLARERHARDTFVQTTARVVTSEVVRERSSSSGGGSNTTYAAEVVYLYEVDGQLFEGNRYAYTAWSSSDRSTAREVVARYPVGSTVPVYYDPDDPEESVLDVSGQAFPRFVVFFLIPFHCVGIGLIYLGLRAVFRSLLGPGRNTGMARHAVSGRPGGRVVIRLHQSSAVLGGLCGAGVVSFVLIFVIGLGVGMNPGGRVLEAGAAATAVAFVVGFGVGWWLDARPSNRLIVDTVRGTYRLKGRPAAPTGEIVGVELVARVLGMTGLPFGWEVRLMRAAGDPLTVCRARGGEDVHHGLVLAIRGAFGLPETEGRNLPG